MRIKTTVEGLDFEDLVSLFSLFNSGCGYWVSLVDWNEEEYEIARQGAKFILNCDDEEVCIEDVWAEMMLMGYLLQITDDEGNTTHLEYDSILWGLEKYFENHTPSLDDLDASDGDMIFQLAILGEVIYG